MTLNLPALKSAILFAIHEYENPVPHPGSPSWNQGTWGEADPRSGMDAEPIPAQDEYDPYDVYVPVTCATSCCLAGATVLQHGARFVLPLDDVERYGNDDEPLEVIKCVDRLGNVEMISTLAEQIIGLTPDQAERLFGGSNGIADVCFHAEVIAREHNTHLGVPEAAPYIERAMDAGHSFEAWSV